MKIIFLDIDGVLNNQVRKAMKRLSEFIKVSTYRWVEFFSYTICGIDFYRNYSRFYWKNKNVKL